MVTIKLVEQPSPLNPNATIWRAYYVDESGKPSWPLYLGSEDREYLKDRVEMYLHPRPVKFV